MGNLSDVIEERDVLPDNGNFDALPKGRYESMINSAELQTCSNGQGLMVVVESKITNPRYEGRRIKNWIVIKHPNEKAEKIGRGKLSALAQACGLPPGIPDDTSDLIGRNCVVDLGIEVYEGRDSNKVQGYYPTTLNAIESIKTDGESVDSDDIPF